METKLRAILPDHELIRQDEQMLLSREFEEVCGSCGRPAEQADLLCDPLLTGST